MFFAPVSRIWATSTTAAANGVSCKLTDDLPTCATLPWVTKPSFDAERVAVTLTPGKVVDASDSAAMEGAC
jgi:hypothetical protein